MLNVKHEREHAEKILEKRLNRSNYPLNPLYQTPAISGHCEGEIFLPR